MIKFRRGCGTISSNPGQILYQGRTIYLSKILETCSAYGNQIMKTKTKFLMLLLFSIQVDYCFGSGFQIGPIHARIRFVS